MIEGRENIPAASAAYLNHAVEPTPNSFRSCVASAIGRGSPPALAAKNTQKLHTTDMNALRPKLACLNAGRTPDRSVAQPGR
jgi:hypothetical protein